MPDLVLTRRAERDLKDLPDTPSSAVVQTLTLLQANPESVGKELRGRLRGLWSCRVGNYGILYTVEGRRTKTRVIVRAIRHRGTAYRGKRRG